MRYHDVIKRATDVALSVIGLVFLLPIFAIISIGIKTTSSGPVFFRQNRVGKNGVVFRIHKFRTMHISKSNFFKITTKADNRITKFGAYLRKYKIDELPQLIDVLYGNMSLVGPRPEVPEYIRYYPDELKSVLLSVKPGITDFASLEFRDESSYLTDIETAEQVYVNEILPKKLALSAICVKNSSVIGDLRILLKTVGVLFGKN